MGGTCGKDRTGVGQHHPPCDLAMLKAPHRLVRKVLQHPANRHRRKFAPPRDLGYGPARTAVPTLGQHSRKILASLGSPQGEIDSLVCAGSVVDGGPEDPWLRVGSFGLTSKGSFMAPW